MIRLAFVLLGTCCVSFLSVGCLGGAQPEPPTYGDSDAGTSTGADGGVGQQDASISDMGTLLDAGVDGSTFDASTDAAVGVDGDVLDGEVSDGDVIDADLSDGAVVDGDVIDGDLSDGDTLDGDVDATPIP